MGTVKDLVSGCDRNIYRSIFNCDGMVLSTMKHTAIEIEANATELRVGDVFQRRFSLNEKVRKHEYFDEIFT